MRIVLAIGVVLLVIVVGGVALIYAFRDPLLRVSLEQIASQAARTPVTIETLKTRIGNGLNVEITDLTVANPQGFIAAEALLLPVVTLSVTEQQNQDGPLVFGEVALVDPVIRYEPDASGALNLDTIALNLRQPQDLGGGGEAFAIRRLEVDQGTIILAMPGETEREITLPGFSPSDLGVAEGGVSGTVLSAQVIEALTAAAARQIDRGPYGSRTPHDQGAGLQ